MGGTGADAGFVGIGDYTAFGAAHLLHVHESTPTTDVGFQVTNNATGILDTDGFLIDVDAAQVANIRQQEAQPMRFHIQDQTLMNNVVQRAEFTYGGAMRENQLTTPVDGFRIWNPGYTMTLGNPDIYIEVKNAEGMIGTLTISKAFIEWKPKNKRYGNRKMRWKMFDKVMEAYSTKNKKTTF